MRVTLAFVGALTAEQRTLLGRAVAACPVAKLMTTAEVKIETVVQNGDATGEPTRSR